MKKHIDSPQRLIKYCIYCAMEHEEEEMQKELAKMFQQEMDRLKQKFAYVLEKEVPESEHKSDFIIDVMRKVR